MSRILRRPMFRGGPVSSYNTGITSGLGEEGYANGGRVGFQMGGTYSSPVFKSPISTSRTFGVQPGFDLIDKLKNIIPDTRSIRQRREEEIDKIRSGLSLEGPSVQGEMEFGYTGFKKDTTPPPPPPSLNIPKALTEEEDIKRQAELYQKLLGGEESKQQALFDALLAASPAFFKGKNLREAAPEVLTAINKSGAFDKPRDIKQAAAQLAIQRQMMKDKAVAEERSRLEYLRLQQGFKQPSITDRLVKLGVQESFGGKLPSDVKKAVPGKFYEDANGKLIKVVQDPKTKEIDFIEYPD